MKYKSSNKKTRKDTRLVTEVKSRLGSKRAFGVSKHKVKQDLYKKTGKHMESPYIHSIETFKSYMSICKKFARWLEENHPDVWHLKYAKKMGYVYEYIQMYIDLNRSAWTIQKIRSALAKLYGCPGPELHDNVPPRRKEDVKKYGNYSKEDYERDVKKFGEVVELLRMLGPRISECKTITKECFRNDYKGRLVCHLDGKLNNTKGGRDRDIIISKKKITRLKEIIAGLNDGEIIYSNKLRSIRMHEIRRMYAGGLYNDYARETIHKNKKMTIKKHGKKTRVRAIYRCRDGRKYDKRALLLVSRALGHNRVNVVVQSYLQFCTPLKD